MPPDINTTKQPPFSRRLLILQMMLGRDDSGGIITSWNRGADALDAVRPAAEAKQIRLQTC
jgi:hypothetical protein